MQEKKEIFEDGKPALVWIRVLQIGDPLGCGFRERRVRATSCVGLFQALQKRWPDDKYHVQVLHDGLDGPILDAKEARKAGVLPVWRPRP